MQKSTRPGLIFFCISLLFLACTIRSGYLVDTTFIPRYTLLALLLLVATSTGSSLAGILKNKTFLLLFILFYGWNLLSAVWSVDMAEAIVQAQLVFLSLALFLVVSGHVANYPEFEKLFIKTHLLVLLFSFALAFYKMSLLHFYDPYKIISVCANNNLYSGFLLISLPLIIAGYKMFRGTWRYISIAAGIGALFFIIIIQSRAAYLGTIAAFIILLVLLLMRFRSTCSKRNMLTLIISVIILAGSIFIFTISLDKTRRQYFLQKIMVWEYFRSYDELQAKKIRELRDPGDHTKMGPFDFSEEYYSNANWRVIFWQKSMGLIKERPLTGVGAGNWRLTVASMASPPNPEHTLRNFTYSEPHNEWIRILSELGITGLLLALLLFFLPPLFLIYRILSGRDKPPVETLIYASFILGFYLFAAFDFPLRRVEHNILLWSIFAFMLNKCPLPEPSATFHLSSFICLSAIRSSVIRHLPSAIRFSVICLSLLTLILAAVRLRSEHYTLLMFRNEKKNDSAVIDYSRRAENQLYHVTPNTLPVAWFEGVALYRRGEDSLAGACFQRALRYTPYEVRVMNDYAATLFRLGRNEDAIRSLKTALLIDPHFDDARFNLGALYYLTGNVDSARAEIERCRESERKRDFVKEMQKQE
jgi:O-antigen ligase